MRGPVITPEMVQRIRQLLEDGLSQRTVAAQLGVSRSSVKKYQTEEAVDRQRAIAARAGKKWRAAKKQSNRAKGPPPRLAIKTSVPLLQELFDIAWKQGKRQQDIAAVARVSPGAVQKWKKGKAEPTLRNLEAVAEVLGYDLVLKPRE